MDIEDLSNELTDQRPANTHFIKARFKSKKQLECEDFSLTNDIPEKYRIFVQTWGCAHNTSDSEYMAGLLAKYGYQVVLGGSDTAIDFHSNNVDLDILKNKTDDVVVGETFKCDCGGSTKECCGIEKHFKIPLKKNKDNLAKQEAHVWILNSCTVKGPAEDHFRNALLDGLKLGKRVIVAGCVPQGRPSLEYLKGVSVIGVQQIDRVVEVVEETIRGNTVRFLEKKWSTTNEKHRLAGANLDLPKIRRNPLIEILAISSGCLNSCTYCKTKHARGVLASYPIEQLLERAKQAFSEGVKELWLTSEDLGAYGRDLDRKNSPFACSSLNARWPHHLTLADLLANLVPLVPPGCLLRLGMTNPPYILDQLDEITQVLSHPRVYAFLHIPVQSGSDAVLDAMRREYTVEEFSYIVEYLSKHVRTPNLSSNASCHSPNGCGKLTIATDIICGFPNETDDDFQQTEKLVEKYRFPVVYINQFYARPGTPAANMPRKSTTSEVKQRTRRLHELFRSYRTYNGRVGCEVRVLITESSFDGNYWVGHTKAYEQILIPKDPKIYGRIVLVRIVDCDKFFMRGEVIDPGPFDCLLFSNESLELNYDLKNLPIPTKFSFKDILRKLNSVWMLYMLCSLFLLSLVVNLNNYDEYVKFSIKKFL